MKKISVIVVLFFCTCLYAQNLEAKIVSVDTALVYRSDGTADVTVKTSWNVSSGFMHAFYFDGEKAALTFNNQLCWAEGLSKSGRNERLPLEITKLSSSKYDVVITEGNGITGTVYFVLTYRAELASSGMVGLTQFVNKEGVNQNLFYFNWAPVDWDDALVSRTTHIVLPLRVPSGTSTLSQGAVSGGSEMSFIKDIGLMTEVNTTRSNKLIDWYGAPGNDGNQYFAIRFYQENVKPASSQPIQFYINADNASVTSQVLSESAVLSDVSDTFKKGQWDESFGYDGSSSLSLSIPAFSILASIIVFSGGLFFLILYKKKREGFSSATALLEDISWAGTTGNLRPFLQDRIR